ncbi:MAG: hypothetical protein RL511_1549 [Bacteroidota bacterium]|jgi:hypothetical protein
MMSIEELERAFLDIDFQANRIAKLPQIDPEHLRKFNVRSEEIRQQLLHMGLHPDLHQSLEDKAPIDENFMPAYNWGKKILNVLLLGQHKKRYIPKQQEIYFRREVAERSRIYSYARGHLSVD